jgi:hypothetical protein
MVTNEEIEAGAKVLAADYWLPGGKAKKVAKLVGSHPGWFVAALKRGMEPKENIIPILSSAGITNEDGSDINEGTLKSALSRKGIYKAARQDRGTDLLDPCSKRTAAAVLPQSRSRASSAEPTPRAKPMLGNTCQPTGGSA